MAITLTSAYLAELRKNANTPNVVLEVALDSGTVKWGQAPGGFSDVAPIVKSVSSLQNKLDPKTGFSTRGQLTIVISGRDNFKNLVANNYLKNRRVTRMDGFIGLAYYSDYAATFTGRISDWSRKGDELTIVISDDLIDAAKKIPAQAAGTNPPPVSIDYRNSNPVDIMTDILLTRLGIASGYVNSAQFTSERDNWLSTWKFDRVITEPREANEFLNELQTETNSFIIHDGEKIGYRVFAPPAPGQVIEEWTDNNHILSGSLTVKSGYKDNFFNRIAVYYDYDESGSDKEESFESAVIAIDAGSQNAAQWNEVKTKTIKSKWLRSRTYAYTSNITGMVVYHVSRGNGIGTGYLTYTAAAKTLQWTAPGGSIGAAVSVSKDGKYQVFDADKTKYVRVQITFANLPGSDKTDTMTVSSLPAEVYASALAQKLLSRFRDPASVVTCDIDINNMAWNSQFIKPTDIKDLTTDEAFEKGTASYSKERMMITSVRPDRDKASIELLETKFYRRYGFIGPAGLPDYGPASATQRQYAFIGDAGNKVNGGTEDGYYIW